MGSLALREDTALGVPYSPAGGPGPLPGGDVAGHPGGHCLGHAQGERDGAAGEKCLTFLHIFPLIFSYLFSISFLPFAHLHLSGVDAWFLGERWPLLFAVTFNSALDGSLDGTPQSRSPDCTELGSVSFAEAFAGSNSILCVHPDLQSCMCVLLLSMELKLLRY